MYPTLANCKPVPIQCGPYRYQLWRRAIPNGFSPDKQRGTLNFIMLNPSHSTIDMSDQTVHNCELFAQKWGFQHLVVTNLFAYVTSNPCELKEESKPVGPANDRYLIQAARQADSRIAAWGHDGAYRDRASWMRIKMFLDGLDLKILRLNKDYSVLHPSTRALTRAGKSTDSVAYNQLEEYELSHELRLLLRPRAIIGRLRTACFPSGLRRGNP